MNLGDLEFKEEDFKTEKSELYHENGFLEGFVEAANRILREKLAGAPEVIGTPLYNEWNRGWDSGNWDSTHRARLVCIEEIGKEG